MLELVVYTQIAGRCWGMAKQLRLISVSDGEWQTNTVREIKNKSKVDVTKLSQSDLVKTETKFLRLVERVIVGGVIPFLGAGLSLKCTGPDGKEIAHTSEMICSVCHQLPKERSTESRCRIGRHSCCNGPKELCGKKRGLAEVCEEYLWGKRRLSKLVLEILQIQKFTALEISTAHRYIVYLARESVIEEVITANYDTSLERAYQESLDCGHSSNRSSAHSVSNLQHYRKVAGIRQQNSQPSPLKVYHINGCASDLEGSSKNAKDTACETILLTERQLQHWGDRQWGRDLLRDRLRCKNIVFSGFGSPEPQVRHTTLQVLEEFELDPRDRQHEEKRTNLQETGWRAPNAVFVHAYEDLTFEQKQMLVAYAYASGAGETSVKSIRESGNCFTRDDASLFAEEPSGCLAADDFWMQVYKAVFWRILTRDWLSYGSPFYYLLLSSISCADVLLSQVRNWLLPDSGPSLQCERLFGRLPKYLDIRCDKDSTILSEHIWHIRYRGLQFPSGWYASLDERGIIISSYFVLVYLLGSLNNTEQDSPGWAHIEEIIKFSQSLGLGLEFPLGYDSPHSGLLVLSHRESLFQQGEPIYEDIGDHNLIVQVVIDSNFSPRRVRVQLKKKPDVPVNGMKQVKYVSVYQISFLDLLGRGSRKPEEVPEFLEIVRRRLAFPSLVTDRSKKRVRDRGRIRRDLGGAGRR